jgi:hypothetical protein
MAEEAQATRFSLFSRDPQGDQQVGAMGLPDYLDLAIKTHFL